MLNTYLNRINKFQEEFLQECFDVIISLCQTQPRNIIHCNANWGITFAKNDNDKIVPFIINGWYVWNDDEQVNIAKSHMIELYGEDGYNKIEDIAHWVDICQDIVMSHAAKCPETLNCKFEV